MSQSRQITKESTYVPKLGIAVLLIVMGFSMFIVGYDQGHLFYPVIGDKAFEDLYLHEFYHDMRHATGFPCH